MTDAAARGWGPGWPNCSQAKIVTRVEAGITWRLRAEAAPVLLAFIQAFSRDVEHLDPAQCGSFACRPVRGTTDVPSNHSWALAVDLNSAKHPWQTKNTFTAVQKGRLRSILALPYFRHIRWGGDFADRVDEMHFEYVGTPADARNDAAHITGGIVATLDKDDITAIGNEVVRRLGTDSNAAYSGVQIRDAIHRISDLIRDIDAEKIADEVADTLTARLRAFVVGKP